MESVSSQSTPIADKPTAASDAMAIVRGLLDRMGRIKYPLVTRVPRDMQSQWMMLLHSPLLDRRRNDVGTIRVYVTTFAGTDNIRVRIEWTRHAYGFWFQEDVWLYGAAQNPKRAKIADLQNALHGVRLTADGGARLKGMIRVHRKVKKNPARDRAARMGLVMG